MARSMPATPVRGRLASLAGVAGGRPPWLGTALRDVVAGISVAFVVVPQSLAYAQLAGLPAEQGLYAASLASIAGAILASSPYLQTGPTAITSLLVLGAVSSVAPVGAPRYATLAALLAVLVGAWRLLLGLLRGGALAYLMSQPVLLGFTSAATILIVASQLPAVLGIDSATANPLAAAWQVVRQPGAWHAAAIAFAVVAGAATLLGKRISPLLPGVLIVVIAAIGVSAWSGYPGPTVGRLPGGLPKLSLDLPWSGLPALLVPSLVIAVLGFAEPLAIARQYAAADRHRWDPNRELASQGLANLASGLGGGYPVGGSFARTALNRLSGARTRFSGAVTGLAALAFVPFAGVLARLPAAVLGAIIIVAVAPLIGLGTVAKFWSYSRPQAAVAATTFAITLALAPRVDLAILAGVLLAVLVHLWRELHVTVPSWTEGTELHLRPRGVLYFASAPTVEEAFLRLLAAHPDAQRLVVHCDGLGRIDLTGALALRAVRHEAALSGMGMELVDVPPHARRIVSRVLPVRDDGSPVGDRRPKDGRMPADDRVSGSDRRPEGEPRPGGIG